MDGCGISECKIKIRLANQIPCVCKIIFCKYHKYPENHNCSFDFKSEFKNKLRKDNPTITGKKINRI